MPLPDQDTGMMDALGQTTLEHLRLQSALQEIFNFEGEHVIETHAALVEHTNAHETANECVTLEETFGIFIVELEELTSGTTNFGKDEGDTPDLTLVAQTVLSRELFIQNVRFCFAENKEIEYLQLGIETGGFKRTTGDLVAV
jgi:hypothetical protein